MVTQNYISSFMNPMSTTANDTKKFDKADNNLYPKFKEIFDKTSAKTSEITDNQDDFSQENKVKDNQDISTGQEVKYKSYKEAVNKDVKQSSPETSDNKGVNSSDDSQKVDGKQKDKNKAKTKENAAVEGLAQSLGVNPQELLQVLNKLNVDPKDLLNTSKVGEITDKLSDSLGLSEQQKQALSEILNAVNVNAASENSKLADSKADMSVVNAANKSVDNSSKDDKGLAKSEGPNVEVINQNPKNQDSKNQDLKAIMDSMKSKVDVLAQKLQQDPQKALSELNSELESFEKQKSPTASSKDEVQLKTETTATKDVVQGSNQNEQQPNLETAGGKQGKDNSGDMSGKKDSGSDNSYVSEKSSTKSQANQGEKVNLAENKPIQADNVIVSQPQKVDNQTSISKVVNDVPVTKSDIINQVVEKAKVVLSGDKSEMVMDLKPDSLGKLSLKVVTERGIVEAKFVAENQQVKEVLESNMQLLKDTLEKQGLSVQGFSVSVRQDSSKGFNGDNEGNDGNGKGKFKSGVNPSNMVNAADGSGAKPMVNPYEWAGSKFNLTA